MAAKLAVIIIIIGAAFGALLVNRQQRIDVVAEVARSQLRMQQHRETISRLQAAVAQAVRPSELEMALARVAPKWENIEYRFDPTYKDTATAKADDGKKPKAGSDRPPPAKPESKKTNRRTADAGASGRGR
ncbi:MAG: hypothetical protein JNM94_03160 [Phycisphaerae bacterium]|nr:hypothetical protein [Phycisphaerae bacterium]